MGGVFATLYSWTPICLGVIGLLVAVGLGMLWAEVGGGQQSDRVDEDEHDDVIGDDRPPWEQPGAVRRDCEPHRGPTLLWLGRLSLWFVGLSLVLGLVSVLVAIPLAIVVLAMASGDRAKMREGTMDPAGDALATGSRYGTAALVVCALVLLGAGCLLYSILTADQFVGQHGHRADEPVVVEGASR